MIPVGGIGNTPVETVIQPSLTWKMDMEKGRIAGNINGLDAVRQAVFCALSTERYRYLIHTWNYGVELNDLIGKSPAYVKSELARRITEALRQDDRIQGIENMDVTVAGDSAVVKFTVLSDYGSFEYMLEVS